MLKVFAKSIFSFMAVMLLLSVVNIGCSSRHLDQNQRDILEQPEKNGSEQHQKMVASAKPKGMSLFTVIELEDLEHPTLATSIQLPYPRRYKQHCYPLRRTRVSHNREASARH